MFVPFLPFDADEDDIAALTVLRDGVPSSLRPAILAWLYERLNNGSYGTTTPDLINFVQSNLLVNLNFPLREFPETQDVVSRIEGLGDKLLLRMVDLALSIYDYRDWDVLPSEVAEIQMHLELNRSALKVGHDEKSYRLARRLEEGTEELAEKSIAAKGDSGRHLSKAWHAAFDLDADPSKAMTEAIRAVEAASIPVVIPKDKGGTLFKVIKSMNDHADWVLTLDTSEDFPDHQPMLLSMLETLAHAQPDRHSGKEPSPAQAQAHVQLASTLVFWFASGAVVRRSASA